MRNSILGEWFSALMILFAAAASITGIATVAWVELYLVAILITLFGLGDELRRMNENR